MRVAGRHHYDEDHGDLGGDEGEQAGQVPAPVDQPEPRAVGEQQGQQYEGCQPGEVPRPVEDVGHPEEMQGHAPATGGLFDDLQHG